MLENEINPAQVNATCHCFGLRKATRAITQLYDHKLESAGVRATQFTLLVTLASVSTQTLTEMAQVLVMDRTTLTRNLKPLEKMGLIVTVQARDKRSKAYALTEAGKEVLRKGIPQWKEAQTKVIGFLGPDRAEALLKELDAFTKGFNSI